MFAGTATALITPFKKDGSIDEECLRRLVDFQEENGVTTLVPCGSTGESATLSHDEHVEVVKIVIDQARKARILAGAGRNSTAEAVMLSKKAADLGADGILSISPYYNKPTQEGIFQHFKAICDAIDIPLVVYNVPGRTGSNMAAETTLRLAAVQGIAAIKEASGNLEQVQRILANKPRDFEVLSGEDSLTFPMMALGASGTISVASNCCPKLVSDMVALSRNERYIEAATIHYKLAPLFSCLFCESNPIPIKYTMMRMGYGNGVPRLPLTPLSDSGRLEVDPVLKGLGLI
jgi:4-hydroxy-tetrahydrodipicolinate synthase